MQVRCPQCHTPIELPSDGELSDIPCPSCGSSFSLLGAAETVPYESGTKTIGHFELVERIGVGTFGFVWKARDTQLDRIVALKIPRKGQLDPGESEQFLREARAAAQLRHPGIVSVHEVGRSQDTVFIVSDFVEGTTLADRLTAQRFSIRESAELCAKIADALHHAHESGVIHRDLKPSNIILDDSDQPHIMDFGLAKREAGEITMTIDGKILGTPAYMSPEQAKGAAHDADQRSDVYSLGVILFELLTGERPFRGNARMLVHQVINDESPSPRRLNGAVPRDLETICLKCLEKEPRKRYETAQGLSKDLRRFVVGDPIEAWPPSTSYRLLRFYQRNKIAVASGMAIVLLLFAGIVATTTAWYRARRAQISAQSAQARAHYEAEERRKQLVIADMNAIQWLLSENNTSEMRNLLKRHETTRDEAFREFEWGYYRRLLREVDSYSRLIPLDRQGAFVSFSPDGSQLAVGQLGQPTTGGLITLFDTSTWTPIQNFGPKRSWVFALSYSPKGDLLAFADNTADGRSLVVRNLATGRESRSFEHKEFVKSVAFSPDGKCIASAGADDFVLISDPISMGVLHKLPIGEKGCAALAFAPEAFRLVSGRPK